MDSEGELTAGSRNVESKERGVHAAVSQHRPKSLLQPSEFAFYPVGITSKIEDSTHIGRLLPHFVVNRIWESFGKQAIKSLKVNRVNSGVELKGINI